MIRQPLRTCVNCHLKGACGQAQRATAACLALLLTTAAPAFADEPQRVEVDPLRWQADIDAILQADAEQPPAPGGVLFVGSSSIRMWQTAESFPELAVINRGFGGSQASDVNRFVEQLVLKYAPRAIVFYAGDNDIADGQPPSIVADDFQTFAERVYEALPDTRIIYISIKPSIARWQMWPAMAEANELIRAYCDGHEQLTFLDIAPTLLGEDGQPRPEQFVEDGLHLSEQGYAAWTEWLTEQLKAPDAQHGDGHDH